jgi:signal transduction histidine kinase
MMQRLISSLEQSYNRHQFTVEHQSDALTIAGEMMQLERVFTNLLTNAAKYSDPGTTISAILTTRERGGISGVYIHIRDEGIGIPAEDLPYVFEPFRRGSNVQEHTSGTGLGLVSARYVVEQHDGIITVTSEEGKGSTFSVWLPLQDGF